MTKMQKTMRQQSITQHFEIHVIYTHSVHCQQSKYIKTQSIQHLWATSFTMFLQKSKTYLCSAILQTLQTFSVLARVSTLYPQQLAFLLSTRKPVTQVSRDGTVSSKAESWKPPASRFRSLAHQFQFKSSKAFTSTTKYIFGHLFHESRI